VLPGSGVVCVLGDAHLDVVVTLTSPVAPDTDTPAAITVGAGGQAANVAAWVVALGGTGRLVAARGSDLIATVVSRELARRGVQLAGPVLEGKTGTVVSVSYGGGHRSMLTDRGVGPLLAPAHIDAGWLDGCAWLHLPAYSLVDAPVRRAALLAAAAAAARSVRISVDLSSTAALVSIGIDRFRELLAGLRPDVVLGNQPEADLVGELPGTELIVKLGAAGVRAGGRAYPALPAAAADSTGAGDAFAAGYLLGGVNLGLRAAARAVATIGGMP
jgi:sugar/nucleoside kinase (ribokinase family)